MIMELPLYLSCEDIRDMAQRSKNQAEKAIAAFTQRLAKDPAYAMEWAQEEYRAAATLDVTDRILHRLQAGPVTVRDLTEELLKETLSGACYPKESTSPVANLLASYRTAVYAHMLKDILGM